MMNTFFAVVPDGYNDPTGLFTELEEAIRWAIDRYGSDAFRIRACCALRERVASRIDGVGGTVE